MLEATPGRPSVARPRAAGRAAAATLLLCGHLDTVTVEGIDDARARASTATASTAAAPTT